MPDTKPSIAELAKFCRKHWSFATIKELERMLKNDAGLMNFVRTAYLRRKAIRSGEAMGL